MNQLASESIIPKYQTILKEIESSNIRIVVLAQMFNYFEQINGENKNIFISLPVNEELGKSFNTCIINSKLQVLVLWGFEFNEESEKLLLDAIAKNGTLRFIFLKDCTMSMKIFELIATKTSLLFFGFSYDNDNKFDIIQAFLRIKQSNPNLILNLLKRIKKEDDDIIECETVYHDI